MSCSKDNGSPTIKFIAGQEFTGKDTVMLVADTLPVTVEISWNGTDVLETLEVRLDDATMQSVTVNETKATFDINLIKGAAQSEKWSFVVIDKSDNQAQINITLTKDPNSIYGAVTYNQSVNMGAQANSTKHGFLSLQTNQYFTLDQAFTNQPLIDLIYYSNQSTQATLASPGSDIPDGLYPGYKDITTWTIRNITHFLKTNWSTQDFASISTDAPIIKGWTDLASQLKADNLAANQVWLFKLKSGKLGALLVSQIVAGDTGEIVFSVKMQE
ncbi:MAG: hypothetical protein PHY99_02695 [Bacteroidales bacterium]|nr:hypothetical protein [Bacteroidales bacterium]